MNVQYRLIQGFQANRNFVQVGEISAMQVGSLLPDRAYAFFSHTHKAQPENMPLLDEV